MKSSALLHDVHQVATDAPAFAPVQAGSPFDLHLTAKIAADQRRLFYALTLPEYLEVWLRMPDTVTLSAVSTGRPNEVRLDRFCLARCIGSILLRFDEIADHALGLTWSRTFGNTLSSTSVRIALLAHGDHCTLELTHTRFRSEEDSHWHRTMWTRSLTDLNRLLSR